MVSNLLLVAGNVLTLFLMMGVGFVFAYRGQFSEKTRSQMTGVLMNVVAPCLIITSMPDKRDAETLKIFWMTALLLLILYVVMILAASLFFRKEKADTRSVLQYGMIYGNVGFMGLPLLDAVLGHEALIFGVISIVMFNIVSWTHGVVLMGGKISVKSALLNPGIMGFVIAFTLYIAGISLPAPVYNAVNYMGSLNTPLAMVVIGAQMAAAKPSEIFKDLRLYFVSAVRLIATPILTLLLIRLLPFTLSPVMALALIIEGGCPVGGTTSMFAQLFHRDTGIAAESVAQSTLLSILTLPVIVAAAEVLLTI